VIYPIPTNEYHYPNNVQIPPNISHRPESESNNVGYNNKDLWKCKQCSFLNDSLKFCMNCFYEKPDVQNMNGAEKNDGLKYEVRIKEGPSAIPTLKQQMSGNNSNPMTLNNGSGIRGDLNGGNIDDRSNVVQLNYGQQNNPYISGKTLMQNDIKMENRTDYNAPPMTSNEYYNYILGLNKNSPMPNNNEKKVDTIPTTSIQNRSFSIPQLSGNYSTNPTNSINDPRGQWSTVPNIQTNQMTLPNNLSNQPPLPNNQTNQMTLPNNLSNQSRANLNSDTSKDEKIAQLLQDMEKKKIDEENSKRKEIEDSDASFAKKLAELDIGGRGNIQTDISKDEEFALNLLKEEKTTIRIN